MECFKDAESQKASLIMNLRHDLEALDIFPKSNSKLRWKIEELLWSYKDRGIINFEPKDLDTIIYELYETISNIYGRKPFV